METIESNKLIAQFMGKWYTDEPNIKGTFYEIPTPANDVTSIGIYRLDRIFYHKSWEWIMPVVEKIEQIGVSVMIGRFFCEMKYIDPLDQDKQFDVRMASGVKINAINAAVIEFIKWHKQSKSS